MGKKVNRERAIAALLSCPTIKEAANTVGVAEKTLHKWLSEDDEFQIAVHNAQDEVTRAAMGVVLRSVDEAASILRAVMHDEQNPPAVRVSAAKAILDNSLKVYDVQTTAWRLAKLEKEAAKWGI